MLVLLIIQQLLLLLVGVASHAPLLVSLASPAPSSVHQLCHNDEREDLLAFKMGFTIVDVSDDLGYCQRPYAKTESWKNGNCCQWDGVTCDPSSGHVTGLDLSCSLLTGSFPSNSTLFLLRRLRHLNLALNYFSWSPIPSGFGRLSDLTYLNISGSGFSGQVPREIGWLSRLTTLDLSSLSATIPNFNTIILNLTDLRDLDLFDMNINSNLPPTVANLSKLESLNLRSCYLQGDFPSTSILGMPNLRVLDLGGNFDLHYDFSTWAGQWRSPLEVVDFSQCNFTGKLPDSITEPSNFTLRSFNIERCRFYGAVPSWIWNVAEDVRACENSLSSFLPATVNTRTLAGPPYTDFSNNKITGTIPAWVFTLPSLTSLHLDGNLFTGIGQYDINNGCTSSSLVRFAAARNQLQGQIPEAIFGLCNLRVLDLRWNSLEGIIPESLNNKHNGTFFHRLGVLPNLEALLLRSNNLQSYLMTSNMTNLFPSLHFLDISHNDLTVLPSGLLMSMKTIPNKITISDEMKFYSRLDASNNRIEGHIPESIGDLVFLQELNLSHNNFTENNLVGLVPTSGQFGTFSTSSYLGNPGLRGEVITEGARGKKDEPSNSTISAMVGNSGSESSGFHEWEIILMGFGFGLYAGSVWGYVIFWETNYYWVVKLIFKIEVFIMLRRGRRRQNSKN